MPICKCKSYALFRRNKQKPQQFGKNPDIHDKAKCFKIEIILPPTRSHKYSRRQKHK